MNIPAVTLEDLRAFQAAHFGLSAVDSSSANTVPSAPDSETDDLGYYPDGVKRTLTDEEIRIFRHSEIHALLREREREREEADSEHEDFQTPAGSDKDSEDKLQPTERIPLPSIECESTDVGAAGKNHQESHGPESPAKGRKRQALDDPKEDAQQKDSGILEYDADPSDTPRRSPRAQRAYARRKVSYADD